MSIWVWNPWTKTFLKLCNLLFLMFFRLKLTFTFQDELILRQYKLLLFYQNHQAKLGLSVWSRIQSRGKISINLSRRDFAQNAELRHMPWVLHLHARDVLWTVNTVSQKLLASGCKLAFFLIGLSLVVSEDNADIILSYLAQLKS